MLSQALVIAFLLLLIQQLIVGSSTIWITKLIGSVQAKTPAFFWLGFYLASLFLPYFPGAGALIAIAKAKVNSQVGFIDKFAEVYQGNIVEWLSSSHRAKKTSTLTGETLRVIDSYLEYIYHLASSGLNVTINIIVLSFVIDPLFLLSYGVGLGSSLGILLWQKKAKRKYAIRAQQGRIKWVEMLLKAWDNILLNNRYNLFLWKHKAEARGRRLQNSALKLERFSQAISISMAFSLLAPSFLLVCLLAYFRITDFVFLAMLVVVLPRLFQILSYSYELLFYLADFPLEKSRLETITNLVNPLSKVQNKEALDELEKRVKWSSLNATAISENGEEQNYPVESLLKSLPDKGRITLRGENGSGKTSFLLMIKQKYGGEAFYLPPKHDLLYRFSDEQLSTGQKVIKILEEIIKNTKTSIILLDEWDANLDAQNTENISKMIVRLAKQSCVIESRHIRDALARQA